MFAKSHEYVESVPPKPAETAEFESMRHKLRQLNSSDFPAVLVRVAESMRAKNMLSKLATDRSHEVRIAVADNPSTPASVMLTLAKDKHPDVRFRVAENPRSPRSALRILTQDENPYVAQRAKKTLKRLTIQSQGAITSLLTSRAIASA
jgi:hypothetical protein